MESCDLEGPASLSDPPQARSDERPTAHTSSNYNNECMSSVLAATRQLTSEAERSELALLSKSLLGDALKENSPTQPTLMEYPAAKMQKILNILKLK